MNFFKALITAYQHGKTRAVLNRLTDAQLKDIGLRRNQISEHVQTLFLSERGHYG